MATILPTNRFPANPAFRMIATVNGAEYAFRFRWSERARVWTMDILLPDESTVVFWGIRIVVNFPLLRGRRSPHWPRDLRLLAVDLTGRGRDPGSLDQTADIAIAVYSTIDDVVTS